MALETMIDETVRRVSELGFVPEEFLTLRDRVGLVPAITQLVEGSEPKDGFLRMLELDLVDLSLETAVTRYPDRFSTLTVAYACARLVGLAGQARQMSHAELTEAEAITEIVDRVREQIAELSGYARDQIKLTLTASF